MKYYMSSFIGKFEKVYLYNQILYQIAIEIREHNIARNKEMQNNPTKQVKQNFLRNEILEGGIDPNCFMDYMGTVKNQGENINIDNWTIEELRKLVCDFKMQIKADTETLEKVKQSQIKDSQLIMSKILESNIVRKEKVIYDKGLWDYEMDNHQKCKTLPRPFKFNPQIKPKVQIRNWEVKSHGGFFLGFGATKQLWLKFETNFTSKAIQRSNSDFEWYRNALLKFNPGFYIPPLSELRAVEADDKKGLSLRSKEIERFLNSLIQYEYLIQSQISFVFLTESDHNKFTNYKNKQSSISFQKNVGRIQTLQGTFQMQISKRIQSFTKNSSLFGKVAQEIYRQLEGNLGKVLSDMQTLSKHVLYVANTCGVLHQKYTKICGLNEIKGSNMQSLMIYLYNMLSNVGKNIKQHMSVIKQFSDEFVRDNIKSWQQFIVHDKRYQREMECYLNFKTDLLRKKQRVFTDVSKWQLQSEKQVQIVSRMNLSVMSKDEVFAMMFPRDNKVQEQLRVWMAYLNKAYEISFINLLREEEEHIKQRLKGYIDREKSLNSESYFSKQLRQLVAVEC